MIVNLYAHEPSFLDLTFELNYANTEIIIEENNPGSFYGLIINTSSDNITTTMIKREIQFIDGWSYSVCLGEICYNENIDTTSVDLAIGDSVSFGILAWSSSFGSSSVELGIFDTEHPNNIKTVILSFNSVELKLINNNNIYPKMFKMENAYPNPFNPFVKFEYDMYINNMVTIAIYDNLGRIVKNLINEFQIAGYKSISWDATDNLHQPIPTGVYLYSIQVGKEVKIKKIVYLK